MAVSMRHRRPGRGVLAGTNRRSHRRAGGQQPEPGWGDRGSRGRLKVSAEVQALPDRIELQIWASIGESAEKASNGHGRTAAALASGGRTRGLGGIVGGSPGFEGIDMLDGPARARAEARP
jgi:hypothetical protein